jgi:hypothetical protein
VSPSIDICKWNPNKKPNGECQPVGMGGGENAGGEGGEEGAGAKAGGAGAGAKGKAGKAAAGGGSAEKQLDEKAKKAEAAEQMGAGATKEAGPAKAES